MKVRPPVIADNHRFAVNQKRCGVDAKGGIYDGREAVGPVMTVAREAPDPRAVPAAVVLDFVNPERAGRRSEHLRRLARLNEAARSLHDHVRCIVIMLPPRDPLCRFRASRS